MGIANKNLAQAIRIAQLWRANKMIGADQDEVRNELLAEVERLHAAGASEVSLPLGTSGEQKPGAAPSPVLVGQGLTDEQIFETALSHGYGFFNAGEGRAFNKYDTYGKKMLAFIRAIEAEVLSKAQDGLVMPPVAAPVSQPDAGTMAMFEIWWHEGAHPYLDLGGKKQPLINQDSAWQVWMAATLACNAASRFRAQGGNTSPEPLQNLATSGHDATGAAKQLIEALKTISEFPITDPDKNMDALNMKLIAADALVGFSAATAPSEADKLDAARYRWLRDPETSTAYVIDKETEPGSNYWEYRSGEELDAAIDAAIAAEPAQPAEGL